MNGLAESEGEKILGWLVKGCEIHWIHLLKMFRLPDPYFSSLSDSLARSLFSILRYSPLANAEATLCKQCVGVSLNPMCWTDHFNEDMAHQGWGSNWSSSITWLSHTLRDYPLELQLATVVVSNLTSKHVKHFTRTRVSFGTGSVTWQASRKDGGAFRSHSPTHFAVFFLGWKML